MRQHQVPHHLPPFTPYPSHYYPHFTNSRGRYSSSSGSGFHFVNPPSYWFTPLSQQPLPLELFLAQNLFYMSVYQWQTQSRHSNPYGSYSGDSEPMSQTMGTACDAESHFGLHYENPLSHSQPVKIFHDRGTQTMIPVSNQEMKWEVSSQVNQENFDNVASTTVAEGDTASSSANGRMVHCSANW